MSATPFSPKNKEDSDRAHLHAREVIYPDFFHTEAGNITYDEQRDIAHPEWGRLDGQMAIDRLIKVTVAGYRAPITFTIQERYRNTDWAHKQDITITEWNTLSNLPSELYKLQANFFMYGYFDWGGTNQFVDAICINIPGLLRGIVSKALRPFRKVNRRTQQPFLCITFDQLYEAGLVEWRFDPVTAYAGAPVEEHVVTQTPLPF